jgi:hypothetical protein
VKVENIQALSRDHVQDVRQEDVKISRLPIQVQAGGVDVGLEVGDDRVQRDPLTMDLRAHRRRSGKEMDAVPAPGELCGELGGDAGASAHAG